MSKLIELIDLVTNFHTYEGVVKALAKVSLTIRHGVTFGLVGESGCGKSVTARSIMRLVQQPGKIESGRILFYPDRKTDSNPVDLAQQSEKYLRSLRGRDISMIFQEPNSALNPILTIGFQVSESFLFHQSKEMAQKVLERLESGGASLPYPKFLLKALYRLAAVKPDSLLLSLLKRVPVARGWDRPLKREAMERCINILAKLGIPHPHRVVKLYPHNLSGGMKQRIVIAIALACHPILLIADEATSNLDVTIQAQILDLIKRLKRKEISSVLLITHDLGVVAEICDEVGVMYAGQLCEVGRVEEIFENPLHPYTAALLHSVPKMAKRDKLETIEGSVPNLVAPPSGCRFHPRCRFRTEVCAERFPSMKRVSATHTVACFHSDR